MSEKIKITIVIDDEKQNTAKEGQNGKRILLTQGPFVTLMSVLQENRLLKGSLCGGRGECGGCAVQFLEGATIPTPMERKHFSAEELRKGYRLACIAKPRTDCAVRLLRNEDSEVPILTKTIPLSEITDSNSQSYNQSKYRIADGTESDHIPEDVAKNRQKKPAVILGKKTHAAKSKEGARQETGKALGSRADDDMDYMIAVDLGTTTIVMQLIALTTGEAADTYCEHNPQRSYGADVLSRIQASCVGHREELQRLVCESLLRGLRQFLACLDRMRNANERDWSGTAKTRNMSAETGGTAGVERLRCICIAGNTTMEHLLMGYDVQSLGRSPFTPFKIGVQETTLSALFACLAGTRSTGGIIPAIAGAAGAGEQVWETGGLETLPVYLTPGISTFVGGDIVAGLYALRMLPGLSELITRRTEKGDTGGVRLLIDLGTNGEMAITDGNRMLVTATAAGPAFEGGGESALIGTDRIALAASFLRRGILDETGLLAEPYFSEGVPVEQECVRGFAKAGAAGIPLMKKEDIRALQMAKAAIRAGIEILWREMSCPRVDRVYLAGGFGYELDVEAAFAIGLLPARLRGRVQAVGNTSLAGAFLMGRALWEGGIDRRALEEELSSGTLAESVNLAKRDGFASLYLQYMNLEEN